MKLGPGTPATGFAIAACLALLAQAGVLAAETPIWDDAVFLLEDERVRSLSSVFTSFGEPFFGPLRQNEMYRPVVNASLAIDWFLSGSAPGDIGLTWFHLVNLLLHAANAGLAYLFLANLTGRMLGAPLLAACLFAVHPLAVEPTAWLVGRCDLLATFFGLQSGILLLRSPRDRRFVVPAVLLFGVSLFAKATAAALPLVVALGVVAYKGVPVAQFFGRRLFPRFAAFAIPAALWIWARTAVLGAAFPRAGGKAWHDVALLDRAEGVGRAFGILVAQIALPARLCGDYSADPAWDPAGGAAGPLGWIGLTLLLGTAWAGIVLLRSNAKVGYPLLAFVVLLVPVLQVVPIGAIVADRFVYLPMLFVFLLVGEGLERIVVNVPRPGVLPVGFVIFLLFGVQSHVRASAWTDPVAFDRDVLRSYPGARNATQRLAISLSDRGDADEAITMLQDLAERSHRPDEEWNLIGAMLIEEGRLGDAEKALRRAVELAGGKKLLGAQARYNLAVVLKNTDRPEEARALLREALRRMPHLTAAQTLLDRMAE